MSRPTGRLCDHGQHRVSVLMDTDYVTYFITLN